MVRRLMNLETLWGSKRQSPRHLEAVMKWSIVVLALSLSVGMCLMGCDNPVDSPDDIDPDPVTCTIASPETGDVVSGDVDIRIDFEGPVTLVELLLDGEEIEELVPSEGDSSATIIWNSEDVDDGTVEFVAHVVGDADEGIEDTSDPVEVTVENTEVIVDDIDPVISLDVDRMSILVGEAGLAVSIDEENVVSVRLLDDEEDEVLVEASEESDELTWDTTAVESKVYWIRLEVEDIGENVAETEAIPVVVANNGYVVEQDQLMYDSVWVIVPEPLDPTLDIHVKVAAPLDVIGSEPDTITRLITWLTWDAEEAEGMSIEYATGQGICPHRGVTYMAAESDTGELIIDMAWVEVPTAAQQAALVYDPAHPEDSSYFPNNGEITTCGAFFGHLAPMDAEDYEGLEFLYTAHFVYINGE